MRRTAAAVAVAAAVLLVPTAALADTVETTSPPAGAEVTSPTPLRVVVGDLSCFGGPRGCDDQLGDDRVRSVQVRLRRGGEPVEDASAVTLSCVEACRTESQTWGGAILDPGRAAVFGEPADFCNGAWQLESVVDVDPAGPPETERSRHRRDILVSAPPVAPDVAVFEGGTETATIRWEPAEDPDLTGYRVERQDGETWTPLGTTGPEATSYTDDEAPTGDVSYRVVSLGADGLQDDRPVTACGQDTGQDLTSLGNQGSSAQFAAASGEVDAAPSPSPSPTGTGPSGGGGPTGGDGSGGGDGGGDGNGPGGSTSGDGGSTSPSDGGQAGDAASGGDGDAGEDAAAQATAPEISDPDPADPEPSPAEEPSYYGESEPFREELDYQGVDEVASEAGPGEGTTSGRDPDEVVLSEAAAGGVVERFRPQRIAVPAAVGLLLVAVALHLRTWMNAADRA